MKKAIIVILSLFTCLSCTYIGGWQYKNIYIYENGELIDAHGYKLKVPATEGDVVVEVVSFGVNELKYESGDKFLTVDNIPYPPLDKDKYEDIPNFYKQTITLHVDENQSNHAKKAKMIFICHSGNGYRAEISIRQAAK